MNQHLDVKPFVCNVCNKTFMNSRNLRDHSTIHTGINRVATAQGIWLLTFPDRENTGNLVNLIFYTGKIVPTQGKF